MDSEISTLHADKQPPQPAAWPPVAKIPVYTYTIMLKDGTTRTCNAVSYEQDGLWWQFDDATGTVLTIRHELVNEVTRGEQIGEQEVDAL